MKNVVIYVRNKNIRPSDYYRIVQYSNNLNANVIIRSAVPDKIDRWSLDSAKNKISRLLSLILSYLFIIKNYIFGTIKDKKIKPEVIIVVREIFPRKILPFLKISLIKKCKLTKLIWDYDDSIIGTEISETEANIYFEYASRIVVSTPYLKEHLPESVKKKTDVLCTTDGDLAKIKLNEINKKRKEDFESVINVVWVATANNMPNLLDVIEYLNVAAKKIMKEYDKELHLKIVCNREVEQVFDFLKVHNITWTHDVALDEILSAHIGIMPLMNNEFALGKAGFKLVQYMAGGLPLIASNVGFNSSLLNEKIGFGVDQNSEEQWVNAIVQLSGEYMQWEQYSLNSRKEWEERYSYQSHLDFWDRLINE